MKAQDKVASIEAMIKKIDFEIKFLFYTTVYTFSVSFLIIGIKDGWGLKDRLDGTQVVSMAFVIFVLIISLVSWIMCARQRHELYNVLIIEISGVSDFCGYIEESKDPYISVMQKSFKTCRSAIEIRIFVSISGLAIPLGAYLYYSWTT